MMLLGKLMTQLIYPFGHTRDRDEIIVCSDSEYCFQDFFAIVGHLSGTYDTEDFFVEQSKISEIIEDMDFGSDRKKFVMKCFVNIHTTSDLVLSYPFLKFGIFVLVVRRVFLLLELFKRDFGIERIEDRLVLHARIAQIKNLIHYKNI